MAIVLVLAILRILPIPAAAIVAGSARLGARLAPRASRMPARHIARGAPAAPHDTRAGASRTGGAAASVGER
jgi:hypothetical protein